MVKTLAIDDDVHQLMKECAKNLKVKIGNFIREAIMHEVKRLNKIPNSKDVTVESLLSGKVEVNSEMQEVRKSV